MQTVGQQKTFGAFLDDLCEDREMLQRVQDKYGVNEQQYRYLLWCDFMWGWTKDSERPRFDRFNKWDQDKIMANMEDMRGYGDSMGWVWPDTTYVRDWRAQYAAQNMEPRRV